MSRYRSIYLCAGWLLPLLLAASPVAGQAAKEGPPPEERDADLVLRVRLVQAETGEMASWPKLLADLHETLTAVGRYEKFSAVDGCRIAAKFGGKSAVKLQDLPMEIEITVEKEQAKGYPLTFRWFLIDKANRKVAIVSERSTKLPPKGTHIAVYQASPDRLPLFLVIDVAPSWENDPLVDVILKQRKKSSSR